VKYILSLLCIAVLLLCVDGCVSTRSAPVKARLAVESASVERLSPSSTSSALNLDAQVATAKVIRRAYDPRFQAEVAGELGVSPETLGKLIVESVANTYLVDVKTDMSDPVLGARVVNAVARKLADDFKSDAEVRVRVINTATPPGIVKETGGK
jgi:hypothetical protein